MGDNTWRGVFTAITTKLDAGENVDLDGVRADVDFQIEGGVDAVICCGSPMLRPNRMKPQGCSSR